MEDIGNLRVNQMEGLLQGLSENAEEQERILKGDNKEILEVDDAIAALIGWDCVGGSPRIFYALRDNFFADT